jgi:hypothetical protein
MSVVAMSYFVHEIGLPRELMEQKGRQLLTSMLKRREETLATCESLDGQDYDFQMDRLHGLLGKNPGWQSHASLVWLNSRYVHSGMLLNVLLEYYLLIFILSLILTAVIEMNSLKFTFFSREE